MIETKLETVLPGDVIITEKGVFRVKENELFVEGVEEYCDGEWKMVNSPQEIRGYYKMFHLPTEEHVFLDHGENNLTISLLSRQGLKVFELPTDNVFLRFNMRGSEEGYEFYITVGKYTSGAVEYGIYTYTTNGGEIAKIYEHCGTTCPYFLCTKSRAFRCRHPAREFRNGWCYIRGKVMTTHLGKYEFPYHIEQVSDDHVLLVEDEKYFVFNVNDQVVHQLSFPPQIKEAIKDPNVAVYHSNKIYVGSNDRTYILRF